MLAFLAIEAARLDGQGPQLSAVVLRVEGSAGQHVVHYEVRNDGSRTAEQVHVVGELVQDGGSAEEVTSTVAYVPAGSSRTGALVFATDPSTGELQVRPAAYTTP